MEKLLEMIHPNNYNTGDKIIYRVDLIDLTDRTKNHSYIEQGVITGVGFSRMYFSIDDNNKPGALINNIICKLNN